MTRPTDVEAHSRLLRRLTVIVDVDRPAFIRTAAIKAVVAVLPSGNPLRTASNEELLDRVKAPWDLRMYLENGRGVLRRVTRPPVCLADCF